NGGGSAYLAAGILGATVMPHVIYLHSALAASSSRSSRASFPSPGASSRSLRAGPDGRDRVRGGADRERGRDDRDRARRRNDRAWRRDDRARWRNDRAWRRDDRDRAQRRNDRARRRDDRERGRLLRRERRDVIVALGLAGLVNLAMLAVAARLFHVPGLAGLSTITQAHAALGRLAGGAAATVFAVALLAAGVSSASVGTFAGQEIMTGFLGLRVPLPVRRAVTMVPALVILAAGVDPTSALVLSQVVLSFGIPFALVPLAAATGSRAAMGVHVNRPLTAMLAWSAAALICGLNLFLLLQYLVPG
ncbi:MAG: Nramp family divalent metal transporter, partial [Nocardiopsaceae bacterium]|nr:Nramp family divalent metal transporter [Nocardiopsaceae bacterium]